MALQGDVKTAQSLFRLGLERPGAAMSIPVQSPYYYGESTDRDDMEWGAVELFRATHAATFLEQAIAFALETGDL